MFGVSCLLCIVCCLFLLFAVCCLLLVVVVVFCLLFAFAVCCLLFAHYLLEIIYKPMVVPIIECLRVFTAFFEDSHDHVVWSCLLQWYLVGLCAFYCLCGSVACVFNIDVIVYFLSD